MPPRPEDSLIPVTIRETLVDAKVATCGPQWALPRTPGVFRWHRSAGMITPSRMLSPECLPEADQQPGSRPGTLAGIAAAPAGTQTNISVRLTSKDARHHPDSIGVRSASIPPASMPRALWQAVRGTYRRQLNLAIIPAVNRPPNIALHI